MAKTKKSMKKRNKTKTKEVNMKKGKQEKMAFLESIFNAITDGITVIDTDCKITLINQSLTHFYGYKNPKNVIGKKCYEIFQGRKTKCKDCPAMEVFKSGKPQHTSHSRVDMHGNETYWELFFYPIYDEKGKVINVVEYSRNITRERKLEEEVKESERKLSEIMSMTKDIIAEVNNNMKCMFVSENIEDILGYTSREAVKAKSFMDFLTPKSKAIAKRYFKIALTGKTVPKSYELEVVHKNGKIIPVETDVSFRRKGDKILGIVATIRDITERKQAEEALRESEEKYRMLLEQSGDVITYFDKKGILLAMNHNAAKGLGGIPDDFIGKSLREMFDMDLAKTSLKRIRRVVKSLKSEEHEDEVEIPTAKGWYRSYYHPMKDMSGNVIGVQIISHNITERKDAEKALKESEEMYKALVETSPDAVTATDLEGKITYVSKRSLELYGFKKPKELIGKSAFKFIAKEDQERALINLEKTLEKGVVRNLEYNFIKKDGTPFIGELNAALIKDASGNPKAFIATTRDVTQRKHDEENLRFRLALEELITTFSTHFIYLKTEEIDDGINQALEKIGSFAGVDRSYVFLLSDNGKKMDNTHEWCAKGIKSQKDQLQGLDVNTFKWGIDRLKKLFPLDIPKVKNLPPEAEADKKVLQSGGIKSMLSVPIVIGGSLFGFIGFDSVSKERTWSDQIISILQIVAEIFAYALERKRAEEVLKESEEKFRGLAEQSPNMIFINRKGAIVYANEECENRMDYSREEFYSPDFDFLTLVAPESIDVIKKNFSKHLRGEEVHPYEYTLITKEGNRIEALLATKLISYGGELSILGIVTDITERKKTEKEIKELKEFNESIVQSMKEGIMILDEEGYVSFINPEIEKILGYKRAKLLGEQWQNIMSPDYHRRMRDCYAENLRGESDRFEAVLLKKDRTELPVLISASPQIKDGIFDGILAVITDISERKKEEIAREELMRYKIKRGSTYLIKEKELERGKDVIYELYKNHFKGVIITREHPDKINREIDIRLPLYWMTNDPRDKMSVKPEFPLLEKIIDDHIDRNTFVFLDRFDYLVSQNSFKDTLNFTQHLNEMFYARKAILIISLDPDTLTAQELSLIEKETSIMEKRHEERLSADLLDLLEFVNRYNRVGESPSYKQVGAEFRISRTTARKRIRELIDKGYLMEKKSGRFKYLVLTERGKDTL